MYLPWCQAVKLLETHNQRTPFIRVDSIGFAIDQKRLLCINSLNSNLKDNHAASQPLIVLRNFMLTGEHRFKLHRALKYTRWCDTL